MQWGVHRVCIGRLGREPDALGAHDGRAAGRGEVEAAVVAGDPRGADEVAHRSRAERHRGGQHGGVVGRALQLDHRQRVRRPGSDGHLQQLAGHLDPRVGPQYRSRPPQPPAGVHRDRCDGDRRDGGDRPRHRRRVGAVADHRGLRGPQVVVGNLHLIADGVTAHALVEQARPAVGDAVGVDEVERDPAAGAAAAEVLHVHHGDRCGRPLAGALGGHAVAVHTPQPQRTAREGEREQHRRSAQHPSPAQVAPRRWCVERRPREGRAAHGHALVLPRFRGD